MKRATTTICTPAHLCKKQNPVGSKPGTRYGRLVVLEFVGKSSLGKPLARAKCDCGVIKIVGLGPMRKGETNSCGCLKLEKFKQRVTTHGMYGSAEHRTWIQLKNRCYNERGEDFPDYGGRGIRVCDRWINSFENFFADMGPRPSPKHKIERVNNYGNYCPENCVWETDHTQSRNKRNNHWLLIDGEILIAADVAKKLEVDKSGLCKYIRKAVLRKESLFTYAGVLLRIVKPGVTNKHR